MKINIIIGIGFCILAALLLYLSLTNKLTGWLDNADKVASVVSLVVAIVAFINPFDNDAGSNRQQSVSVGKSNGSVNIGQAQSGGSVIIGDASTSADRRANAALEEIKDEALGNFNSFALLIQTLETLPAKEFWDKRRVNESELAYQDRATQAFRDHVSHINGQIKLLQFSKNSYQTYQRDLSHNKEAAKHIKSVYTAQDEVADSFSRLTSDFQHLIALEHTDVERTEQAISLQQERLTHAKMVFSQSAASFSKVATPEEVLRLADSYSMIGIDVQLQPGQEGYKTGMGLASRFAKEKLTILQARSPNQEQAKKREIDRRITDPYLLKIRELAGLPNAFTTNELAHLETVELNTTEQDPAELFSLANFSFNEMDGGAAVFYYKRALDTGKLSERQARYAKASIHRIQNPDYYESSLGIMVLSLTEPSNFEASGLRQGDVIISVDGETVLEPLDIGLKLARTKEDALLLTVIRDDRKKMAIPVKSKQSAGALLTQLVLLNPVQL